MSQGPGPVVIGILRALGEMGPMSGSDLSRELGGNPGSIRSVLARLSKPQALLPKRIYVSGWTHDADGERRYLRPVYSLGDKKNKARPAPDRAKADAAYRGNNRGQVSSVWDLAKPRRTKALSLLT